MLSVKQAADILNVSEPQVGRLIAQGDLDAKKFGRSWALDAASVHAYAALRPARGRPLAPLAAWSMLQSRPSDVAACQAPCRRRSHNQRVRVVPGLLSGLLEDRRCVLGGGDAGLALDAAISAPALHVVYVRAEDLGILDEYQASSEGSPNVMVRSVPSEVWPFVDRVAPAHVAALDLIDIGDERSAHEVLAVRS